MTTSNTVTAPRQFGNPIFDKMSCPTSVLPSTFTVQVNYFDGSNEVVSLKTDACVWEGDFVARRYTGIQTHLVYKELRRVGFIFKGITFRSQIDGINILEPDYN